jgi:2-methylisocitrate lyase-like PEP mutase family enzyme
LATERGVLLPGAANALTARIIADLGFKAIYLTGATLTCKAFQNSLQDALKAAGT